MSELKKIWCGGPHQKQLIRRAYTSYRETNDMLDFPKFAKVVHEFAKIFARDESFDIKTSYVFDSDTPDYPTLLAILDRKFHSIIQSNLWKNNFRPAYFTVETTEGPVEAKNITGFTYTMMNFPTDSPTVFQHRPTPYWRASVHRRHYDTNPGGYRLTERVADSHSAYDNDNLFDNL